MNLRTLRKLIKNKEETELTNYKGEGWVLHICKNNVPVPLFHSKDIKEIKEYLEIQELLK
ncbi:MAG: hypothetical protein KKB31_01630 [Nanoarchaeota archaeon]|nr:hypothetical protein [Nanoarchaeota archaeon]